MTRITLGLFAVLFTAATAAADNHDKPGKEAKEARKEAKEAGKEAKQVKEGKEGKPPSPEGAAAMAMPKPAPELDTIYKPFEGNWKCDTRWPAGAMGPGSPEMTAKTTVKIKKDPNGWAYRGEYDVKKTKTTPGMKGSFVLGYASATKEAYMLGSDSWGSATLAVSPTATPDTLTFVGEGYMMGQKVKMRETMSKRGEKEIAHKYETDMGKGWQTMGEDTCKK